MSTLPHHRVAAIGNHTDHHDCTTKTSIESTPKLKTPIINPKPIVTPPEFDDLKYKSTWFHHLGVATGCTTVLFSLACSIVGSIRSQIWVEPVFAGFIGYFFADLVSGVYHWAIDNYGNASTPIFGSYINTFQMHHRFPLEVTKYEFANTVFPFGHMITCVVLLLDILWYDRPVVMGFVGVAGGFIMFIQQFHAWAHMTKNKLPKIVVVLQDAGLLVSRSRHIAHHKPPFNTNYCGVSEVWNRILDENKVFKALETVVFSSLGVRPRSWSEPDSKE